MDQKESTSSNTEFILTELEKHYVKEFESFFSGKELEAQMGDIKVNGYLIATNGSEGLLNLCGLYGKSNENAIKVSDYKKLSKKGRVKLVHTYDIFRGIRISCVDPSEIIEVTLNLRVMLPKQFDSFQRSELFDRLDDYVYHNSNTFNVFYIPIKKITNPKTNYIEFFSQPIPICWMQYSDFSISILTNRNENSMLQMEHIVVELNHLMVNPECRKYAVIFNHFKPLEFYDLTKSIITNNIAIKMCRCFGDVSVTDVNF